MTVSEDRKAERSSLMPRRLVNASVPASPRRIARRVLCGVYAAVGTLVCRQVDSTRLAPDARAATVRVQTLAGHVYTLHGLSKTSTYLDLYQAARLTLGIPVRASSISLALVFHSTVRHDRPFVRSAIVPALRTSCWWRVHGCLFDAVMHH